MVVVAGTGVLHLRDRRGLAAHGEVRTCDSDSSVMNRVMSIGAGPWAPQVARGVSRRGAKAVGLTALALMHADVGDGVRARPWGERLGTGVPAGGDGKAWSLTPEVLLGRVGARTGPLIASRSRLPCASSEAILGPSYFHIVRIGSRARVVVDWVCMLRR